MNYITIFVMRDQITSKATDFKHVPGGSNILYLDGHVASQRFASHKAPLQPGFAGFDRMIDEGA